MKKENVYLSLSIYIQNALDNEIGDSRSEIISKILFSFFFLLLLIVIVSVSIISIIIGIMLPRPAWSLQGRMVLGVRWQV